MKEAIGMLSCEPASTPKIEFSDRLSIIKNDLGVVENILNDALYKTCMMKHLREEEMPPIESHTHALELIENRVYWVKMIAEKLEQALR